MRDVIFKVEESIYCEEEDTDYDNEDPYRVEKNACCASCSGHGLLKPFDCEASRSVVAPYE